MSKTKLTINNNGSVKIEGDFEIVDRNGNVYGLQGREVLSICRCGMSKNKPFCDGAHNGHFEHEAVAFDLPLKKFKEFNNKLIEKPLQFVEAASFIFKRIAGLRNYF